MILIPNVRGKSLAFVKAGRAHVVTHMGAFCADEWNRLSIDKQPFLRQEFLLALENKGCLSESFGWYPHHLAVRNNQHRLMGAMPMYIKTNSYGEFVFDWAWASAYERAGLAYYPKLVIATPYNPIPGARLLTAPEAQADQTKTLLIDQAIEEARQHQFSGVHWLFTTPEETRLLESRDLLLRLGCQYHWHNNAYGDFGDFLAKLTSRKRKKIRRERRHVLDQGVSLRIVSGSEANNQTWKDAHQFYQSTFDLKSGIATLTLEFFKEIGRTLGEQIVLVFADYKQRTVACAINFRDQHTLYGRFWGCAQDFHSLHFETCYYQGIEYCIQHGLQRFEPGAQGEHKIARGFLPTQTWSAHWIADKQFRQILADYCRRERTHMSLEYDALCELSPYRENTAPPAWCDIHRSIETA